MLSLGASTVALASDLAGVWENTDQPAAIEISFVEGIGSGTVVRNEVKPEAVGRLLLKDITGDSDTGPWQAQIFAERLNEYKDASIRLLGSGNMEIKVKVGFFSKTVEWRRGK